MLSLQSAALRSSSLELLGSGIGSVALPRLLDAIGGAFDTAAAGQLGLATVARPFADVAACWDAPAEGRTVFVP